MRVAQIISILIFWSLVMRAQDIPVHFSVNMNLQIAQGKFNPAIDFVDIAGNFNGWGASVNILEDSDLDGIYETTLEGFTAFEFIEFKFRLNATWNGTEEFPGVGNNRTYTVQPEDNDLYFWYNDEIPNDGPPIANFDVLSPTVRQGGLVRFENRTAGSYLTLDWHFAGGHPQTSSEENPLVRYEEPGQYDVTLIARGENEHDTITLPDAVRVKIRDTSELEWWNDAVFYEILVRSFYDSDGDGIGDFRGIIEKLDYLNDGNPETTDDLGITGIWLMPIHPSPTYHGYDAQDYLDVNPDYGTLDDFRDLLEAAHARDIRVIIDMVMNHCSIEHPWFQAAKASPSSSVRDWFIWSAEDPMTGAFGPGWHWVPSGYYYGAFWSGMPDLNYETPELRQAMLDVVAYWLDDVGVDGFRLDAVRYLYESESDFDDLPETYGFWKDYTIATKEAKASAFSVGEAWTSTSGVQPYVENGGIDVCFEFDLAFSILAAVNTGFGFDLSNKMREVYNTYPHLQFATFLTNHDIDRVWNVLGKSEVRMKNAASIYLTLPGIPFLYYGEEIGMSGSKPDPDIRKPMQWSDQAHAGFTTGVPWQPVDGEYTTANVAVQDADPESLLNYYRKLIRLRMDHATLRKGDYSTIPASSDGLFAYELHYSGESIVVVHNLTDLQVASATLDCSYTMLDPGEHRVINLLDEGEQRLTILPDGKSEPVAFGPRETRIWRFTSTTGTREPAAGKLEVVISPNPAQLSICLELPRPLQGDRATYHIRSMVSGTIVRNGSIDSHHRIAVHGLADGAYVVEVDDGNKVFVGRFIVVR